METMKPIASDDTPLGNEWVYEIKYDGFRCLLDWSTDTIRLMSRNQKDLTAKFPEIIAFCKENQALIRDLLPVQLDGELTVLNHPYQANFALIQKRGRLSSETSIQKASQSRPATFLAFDLLKQQGKCIRSSHYQDRKGKLRYVLEKTDVVHNFNQPVAFVQAYNNAPELKKTVFDYKAEGIIAKRKKSSYVEGDIHQDWFKIKNWRTVHTVLTSFNPKNDYFTACVYDHDQLIEVGKCKHGLDKETAGTLKQLFVSQAEKQDDIYTLPPAICAAIHTLDLHKGELREPSFSRLLPDAHPQDLTARQLQLDIAMLPDKVEVSHTDKIFWPEFGLTKGDLLVYIREIAPYMLPFLQERVLTIIRSPDGVQQEHFFQKNLPEYAPDFIEQVKTAGKEQPIICNTLDMLLWFANHGAIEYHVPFQKINQTVPAEIVFDLDPPGREKFDLAIQAALLIKQLLDDLMLISFVKTSGSKGLQIHVPITEGSLNYKQTAAFTQAIARTLERAYPHLFTTERFKNKRYGRLYIDYVQHGKDKTLIAPYSPRKTNDATVATPLFWEEVKDGLIPDAFTITNVLERVQTHGCPFSGYFAAGKKQKLDKLLQLVT